MDPLSFLAWRFYYFWRDPVRRPPPGRVIVSPADGYLLYARRVEKGEVPSPIKKGVTLPLTEWVGAVPCEESGTLIGVHMTAFSVHYNRAPIAGRIERVVPRPAIGENLGMTRTMMRLLWGMQPYEEDSRYITQNARNTTVIDGDLRVVVVQIADRYVKDVDSFVAGGQRVGLGEKIGMIRMGSQCDLFIPDRPGLRLQCEPGARVRAGESILATY